jgi:phosphoenolpyruvate-protein kinase (PTS system EI component)
VARLIIYWATVRKVDLQKELEMQAELLNNNILQLQEKLEKTSDKAERARLQNIINKQIEMLVDLQDKIKKYIDEEYEASVAAHQEVEDSDSQIQGENDDFGNGDFEISI